MPLLHPLYTRPFARPRTQDGAEDPRHPSYTRIHVIVQEQSDAVSDNGDTPGVPEFRYVNDIVRILR